MGRDITWSTNTPVAWMAVLHTSRLVIHSAPCDGSSHLPALTVMYSALAHEPVGDIVGGAVGDSGREQVPSDGEGSN